jgi:hypothetical protein
VKPGQAATAEFWPRPDGLISFARRPNMAVVTVGELLDRGHDFESKLDAYYAEVRDQSPDNSVRLVTYYLARHRRHQERALGELDPNILQHLREMGLTFDASLDAAAGPRLPDFAPEAVKGNVLIEAAVSHGKGLVSLYRSILAQPLNEDVQTVLEALIRVEEREIVMMKKMLAMHYF